jgi:uncharacterized protein
VNLLKSDTPDAVARLILAHGAGAAMDSAFMNTMTELLAARRIDVWRFEFPYMAERRRGGKKRPAPKADTLLEDYRAVIAAAHAAQPTLPLVIGGKSMGGRVASMLAQEAYNARTVVGLVCLGYPFHPPNQPQTWRTGHLVTLSCPALIVQGERDPFGTRAELQDLPVGQTLSSALRFQWIGDGDHDLGPRGGQGYTRKGNLTAAADAVATFVSELVVS